LAALAQDRIVLLSTHIVEDVAVLCTRFAVIRNGRLVAQTSPSEALSRLNGAIYEATVSADELESLRKSRYVTQAVLFEGKNRVRVYETDGRPPNGFVPAVPTLEDAYFLTMRGDLTNGTPVHAA
jgi:ABC-type multidrug transport system ATPase subunit